MDSNNFTRSPKLLHLSNQFRQSKHVSLPNTKSTQPTRFKTTNRAAVLICLFEEHDDIYVILTKRSSNLSSFTGQVLLPGGRRDEGDTDDVRIALREAHEEIGLDPKLVDVVTVLEPFASKNKNRQQEEIEFQAGKGLFHYFDHETNNKVYTIWAMTATILIAAATLFYQRPPDFQPRMPKS
ncbi:nudix hydrolase 15, mitochondrial-like isoform X2 [Bidens hawaiensis]|uniref:nudix hydrolase 15, mitochondrial-like isoform X2 n=1 Tax=Bidens hawaiensis TaxID=980011 RepID=UPI00404AB3F7